MKRKYLIILFFFILLICFFINKRFKNNNIDYVAISSRKDDYRYTYEDYFIDYLKEKGVLKTYNKNYIRYSYTIKDILDLIDSADKKESNGNILTITKIIHDSDIITLELGSKEIEKIINDSNNNKEIYKNIDKMIEQYKELISKIRFLTKGDIIIIGYYNTFDYNGDKYEKVNNVYKYAENKLNELLEFKNVHIINLMDVFNKNSKYLDYYSGYSLSMEGHKYICDKIVNYKDL